MFGQMRETLRNRFLQKLAALGEIFGYTKLKTDPRAFTKKGPGRIVKNRGFVGKDHKPVGRQRLAPAVHGSNWQGKNYTTLIEEQQIWRNVTASCGALSYTQAREQFIAARIERLGA